eukprot:9130927-Alexandrium_andersonii.AAC.1
MPQGTQRCPRGVIAMRHARRSGNFPTLSPSPAAPVSLQFPHSSWTHAVRSCIPKSPKIAPPLGQSALPLAQSTPEVVPVRHSLPRGAFMERQLSQHRSVRRRGRCLLYTSDAADDM